MKTKIIICTLVLMFSAFAGSVWGGTENTTYTYYGMSAGKPTPPVTTTLSSGERRLRQHHR